MAMPLDDFQVILGLEFFTNAKASVILHLHGLFVMDMPNPCFVHLLRVKAGNEMCSAIQVSNGLEKGEMTYLAVIFEEELHSVVQAPKQVRELLEEYDGAWPS
jgi:hypothetical protein